MRKCANFSPYTVWGGRQSCMTFHPIPLNFLYTRKIFFSFYECIVQCPSSFARQCRSISLLFLLLASPAQLSKTLLFAVCSLMISSLVQLVLDRICLLKFLLIFWENILFTYNLSQNLLLDMFMFSDCFQRTRKVHFLTFTREQSQVNLRGWDWNDGQEICWEVLAMEILRHKKLRLEKDHRSHLKIKYIKIMCKIFFPRKVK